MFQHVASLTDLVLTISRELEKNDPRWWGMIPRDPGLLVVLEPSPDIGEPPPTFFSHPGLENLDIPGRLAHSRPRPGLVGAHPARPGGSRNLEKMMHL